MEADLSLPNWGGWSALPPTAGGGRAAILPWIKFVALRLAKRPIGTHVRNAIERRVPALVATNGSHWLK